MFNDKRLTIHSILGNYTPIFFFLILGVSLASWYRGDLALSQLFTMPIEPPWLPNNISPTPIMGNHYFGDFQLPWVMANESNPFQAGNIYNNILPFGYLLFLLMGPLSLKAAFYFYVIITVALYLKAIRITLNNASPIPPYCIAAFPLIWALDRGAPILLVASLFVICSKALMIERENVIVNHLIYLGMAFCISAKIYLLPSFLILVLIDKRMFSRVYWVAFYGIITNVLFSYIFSNPVDSLKQIVFSLRGTTENVNSNYLESINFQGLIVNLLRMVRSEEAPSQGNLSLLTTFFTLVTLVTFFLTVVVVIRHKDMSVSTLLSLSMIQYFSTVSFRYTSIWAVFGLLIFYGSKYFGTVSLRYPRTHLFIGVTLVIHILPLPKILILMLPISWGISMLLLLRLPTSDPENVSEQSKRHSRSSRLRRSSTPAF